MRLIRILKRLNIFLGIVALSLFILGGFFIFLPTLYAQAEESSISNINSNAGWGFIASALAVGFSSLAAGIAVSSVGSAAMGAVSERPELMGRSLIYVGLAEGIAIYGLIVSIMILGRI